MSEISSGTIKEICDAVCKDVLDEVKESLSQMKPHIVQEIVEEVIAREKTEHFERIELALATMLESDDNISSSSQLRVHEVAKCLRITSKEIIEYLRECGFIIKNHMSFLNREQIYILMKLYVCRLRGKDARNKS